MSADETTRMPPPEQPNRSAAAEQAAIDKVSRAVVMVLTGVSPGLRTGDSHTAYVSRKDLIDLADAMDVYRPGYVDWLRTRTGGKPLRRPAATEETR